MGNVVIAKTPEVLKRNAEFPDYSECARCGGNWGWKKSVDHKVDERCSVFLFCEECDDIVSLSERWKAFDVWKGETIASLSRNSSDPILLLEETKRIIAYEFVEFPRGD